MRHVSAPVFVGRAEELGGLRDVVTRPPAVGLVEGESGIGKTRLVRELLDDPVVADRPTLVGGCHPIREPFPYGPVLELLRQAGASCPPAHSLNPVTGALRPYLPELGAHLPPAPEALGDARAQRHQLFRAVRELLAALGPAVAVIEDLHWADDGSRDLLRFLADDPPSGLAVVLTYRREDLPGPGLPFGRAYRPPPGVSSVRIALSGLDTCAVREFAEAVLTSSAVSTDFAKDLHQRTAGIPFVLEELLPALENSADWGPSGRDDGDTLRDVEPPLLLREAMADRIAVLSEPATEVVRAAAVLRRPATEDALAHVVAPTTDSVAGLPQEPERKVKEGLQEALQAGVLHEFDVGCYGFRHFLAQRAVYDILPGPERRQLHRRAADMLDVCQPRPLVELAYHTSQSGDTERWLRCSEEAAGQAQAVGDNAIAVALLGEALSCPQLSVSLRGRLAVKLSRAAVTGLSCRSAVSLLRGVLRDVELPDLVRGEVRLNLVLLLGNQDGYSTDGRADMKLAIEELRDHPGQAARAMAAMALPAWGYSSLAAHRGWMEKAQELVSGEDDPALTMGVFGDRLTLHMDSGEPGVWRELDRLPTRTVVMGERHQLARTYANLAEGSAWLGHYEAAGRFQRRARELSVEAQVSGDIDGTGLRIDWATGRWDGLAERARAMLELTGDMPWVAGDSRLVLGSLAVARGEWEEADEQLHACGLEPETVPFPVVMAASAWLGRLLMSRDDVSGACAEVDRAVDRLRRKGIWVWAGELAPVAVDAFARAGRGADAEAFTAEFARGIADRDAPLPVAALASCRGILAMATRRYGESAQAFGRARAEYERLPRPYCALRSGEAEARSRIAAGERLDATSLTSTADGFAALGASRDAARCRSMLRETGVVDVPRRGRRGYGPQLSPREKDVARLVRLDKTNREIAEVLFLSPRTVEQHVAQVLRKLRVSSRGAVASALTGTDI